MARARLALTTATDGRYRVIVIELDDVLPRLEVGLPNLLVLTTVSAPEDRLARLNGEGGAPAWAAGHGIAVRDDLSLRRSFAGKGRADTANRRLVDRLLRRGYVVNRRRPQRRLYVIELDGSHLTDAGLGFLYVGETSKTPEERFREHRDGAVSSAGTKLWSKWVHKYGVRLRPDLMPGGFFLTKAEAEAAEADLRLRLEAKGYVVKGGHLAQTQRPARDQPT